MVRRSHSNGMTLAEATQGTSERKNGEESAMLSQPERFY